ncbi:hypothetical protein RB653_006756 [Dictyostelium firmibasis]|uniref:C2 domain-containing protein n=1 Tax=Dictyostelium firmibasis TaxID=79012 RepID=A0AAN7TUE4_9MYCE
MGLEESNNNNNDQSANTTPTLEKKPNNSTITNIEIDEQPTYSSPVNLNKDSDKPKPYSVRLNKPNDPSNPYEPQPGQYGQIGLIQQQQYYQQQQQQQQQQQYAQQQQYDSQQQYYQQQYYQEQPQAILNGGGLTTTTTTSSTQYLIDPTLLMIPTGPIATFDMNSSATIDFDSICIPETCTFYTSNPIGKGRIQVRIISANNLIAADIGGTSDPYVKIKSSCLKSFKATRIVDKCLNPVWEETLSVEIDCVQRELLMFDVYDHDVVGCDDLLGYVGIDVSKLPLGIEVITNENLSFAKHGTLRIGLTALDFGLTNLPQNYLQIYQEWRTHTLGGITKKNFKSIKKGSKVGPYIGKLTHPHDYKLVNGFVKRRKTKREKTADGIITGLKVAGVVALVAISS